jgi:hypothetical protein
MTPEIRLSDACTPDEAATVNLDRLPLQEPTRDANDLKKAAPLERCHRRKCVWQIIRVFIYDRQIITLLALCTYTMHNKMIMLCGASGVVLRLS